MTLAQTAYPLLMPTATGCPFDRPPELKSLEESP
jgi:hypothetical protein